MNCTNILFEVSSRAQANELCAICTKYYTTAKVTSVGFIGSRFASAPAVIRCTYEGRAHGKMAWDALVTHLYKVGLNRCISH